MQGGLGGREGRVNSDLRQTAHFPGLVEYQAHGFVWMCIMALANSSNQPPDCSATLVSATTVS